MGRTINLVSIGAAGLLVAVVVYQQRELGRLRGEMQHPSRAVVSGRRAAPASVARWDRAPAPAPVETAVAAQAPAPVMAGPSAAPPALTEAGPAAASAPAADQTSPEAKLRANLHRIGEYQRQRDMSVPAGRRRWVQTLAARSQLTDEQSAGLIALLDQEFEQIKEVGAEVHSGARGYDDAQTEVRQLHADIDVQVRKLLTESQFHSYVRSRAFSGPGQ